MMRNHPSVRQTLIGVAVAGLAALLAAHPAVAQTNYFPLEIGNSWTYYSLVETAPGGPFDTVSVHTVVIEEEIERGSQTYFIFDHPEAFTDTVRADAEGRIWGWMGDKEQLYFDPTVEDGGTYSFSDNHDLEYEVVVDRGVTVETAAGIFEDCIYFHFRVDDILDADHGFYLAPGVGIVQTLGRMGEPTWLRTAVIGGSPLAGEGLPDFATLSVRVYPNPVRENPKVAFALERSEPVEIRLVDALGRTVATIASGRLAAGTHELVCPAQGLAAGVYFVVLTTAAQHEVRSVILTN